MAEPNKKDKKGKGAARDADPDQEMPQTQTPTPANMPKSPATPRSKKNLPLVPSPTERDVRSGKRTASKVSHRSSSGQGPEPKTPRRRSPERSSARDRAMEAFGQGLDALSRLQSERLAEKKVLVDELKKLNAKYQEGTLENMSRSQYEAKRTALEKEVGDANCDLIRIRTTPGQLVGEALDAGEEFPSLQSANDWEYLDKLISRYRDPEDATVTLHKARDSDAQARFRTAVLNFYEVRHQDSSACWCVVHGDWAPAATFRAAHIVRYNVGEICAHRLFGKPSSAATGHLMSPRNALPMCANCEALLDEARMAIVPATSAPDCSDWKVLALYKADVLLSKLDGKLLAFKNEARPMARYLYFAFCINILRRQRHEVRGWWKDRLEDCGLPRQIWASPGAYLKSSTLNILARNVGHMPLTDTQDLLSRLVGGYLEEEKSASDKDEVMSLRVEAAYLDPERRQFQYLALKDGKVFEDGDAGESEKE